MQVEDNEVWLFCRRETVFRRPKPAGLPLIIHLRPLGNVSYEFVAVDYGKTEVFNSDFCSDFCSCYKRGSYGRILQARLENVHRNIHWGMG